MPEGEAHNAQACDMVAWGSQIRAGMERQGHTSRRAVVATGSAMACVAAILLLGAGGGGSETRRDSAVALSARADQRAFMPQFDAAKALVPPARKMFTTAIAAAMAAVKDARGNFKPSLAQGSYAKPRLRVVKTGQMLQEAEPAAAAAAVATAAPEAAETPARGETPEQVAQAAVAQQAGAEEPAAEPEEEGGMAGETAGEPVADGEIAADERPPMSPEMLPPGSSFAETIDPNSGGPPLGYYPSANTMVEPAMGQQPQTLPASPVQIAEQPFPNSGAPGQPVPIPPGYHLVSGFPGAQVPAASPPAPAPASSGDMCIDGQHQSPINLELNIEAAKLPVLSWQLSDPAFVETTLSPVAEDGQGKWLRVVQAGLSMSVKGFEYPLRSLVVKSPSEHTIVGQRFDMELQFLHSAAVGEQQKYVLVSALVSQADSSAPVLKDLVTKLEALDTDQEPSELKINIRDLAMAVLGQTELVSPTATNAENYFQYDGSFTTAPCTEGVTWLILKNPLQMALEDMEALAAALPQTSRAVQPMGTRVVLDRHVLS